MKVDALLRRKGSDVATIHPDATVGEAVAELTRRHIGALVVSANGVTVDGIVSERDVVANIARSGPSVLDLPVASIMVTEVEVCRLTDHMASLMEVMTRLRIRHLPVVEGGRLAGIVSIGDVVKARVDELEADRQLLHEYIGAR